MNANDARSSTPPVAGQLVLSQPTNRLFIMSIQKSAESSKLISQSRRWSDGKVRPCSNRGPTKRADGNQSASDWLGGRYSSSAAYRQRMGCTLARSRFLSIAHQCCIFVASGSFSPCIFNIQPFQVFHRLVQELYICAFERLRQSGCNSRMLLLLRQLEQEFRVPAIPPHS